MGRFVMDKAGIEEICKSAVMQELLGAEAEKLCAQANKIAESHLDQLKIDGRHGGSFAPKQFGRPPYAAHVDVLDHTAVGAVHTNSKLGRLDHAKFSTLNAANH